MSHGKSKLLSEVGSEYLAHGLPGRDINSGVFLFVFSWNLFIYLFLMNPSFCSAKPLSMALNHWEVFLFILSF